MISSGNFEKYPDDVILPAYRQLIVDGIAFKDDFGIYTTKNGIGFLILSEKALKILLNRNCQNIRGEKIPTNIDLEAYFQGAVTKLRTAQFYPYFHESMFFNP